MRSAILLALSLSTTLAHAQPATAPRSVEVGGATWMAEDLNVDAFRNGDPIPQASTPEEWKRAGQGRTPAWCYYGNDPSKGRLYNAWAVQDPRGLAPAGWRVPSDAEWTALAIATGANAAKTLGLSTGGYRDFADYSFFGFGEYGNYWTATSEGDTRAWTRSLSAEGKELKRDWLHNGVGLSVRLVADSEPAPAAPVAPVAPAAAPTPQAPPPAAPVAAKPPMTPEDAERAKKALAERQALGQKAANLADAARRAAPEDKPELEAKRDEAILQWADAMFEEARSYEARGQPTDAALRAEQVLNEFPAFPALEARRAQALEIFERGTEEGFGLAQERAARGRWVDAASLFNHRRAGAPLAPDHPRNRWFAELRAKGAEQHRALAAQAEAEALPGAALLHRRLALLLETGESKGGQREALRTALEPRFSFEAPAGSCAALASVLSAPAAAGGVPTPVRLDATCKVQRSEEVREEPYKVVEMRQVKRKTCRDTYRTFTRPLGKDKVLTETIKGDPVCEDWTDEVPTTVLRRRKVHHRYTLLAITGTMTLGDGERAVSGPVFINLKDDDQAYSSPDGNRSFLGDAEPRLRVEARGSLAKAVEELAPKYRALGALLQAARAEQATAAGRALEAEDAWMLAAMAGAPPPAASEWIGQQRGLWPADLRRLAEDADLDPIQPWSLPSQLPNPEVKLARRSAWSGFSFRPDSRLDHMAWFFAAGGYARPADARLLSAGSLSVGLEALRTNRDSAFSLAWNWGGELGLDHRFSFLFDVHGGFGAALTLWRFTLAPMAMIGVDRMVIDGADGSLVPLAFDYGGAGHLVVELARGVALDGHAAYLFRTGGNPGELRAGARLAITIGKRALFLGVRYHDYGRAAVWSGFVGYGGD